MKIVFLGATKFSQYLLEKLIESKFDVSLIIGIPQSFNISYSEDKVKNYLYSDLKSIAAKNKIQYLDVDSSSGKTINDCYDTIRSIQADVILVLGWYYMVPKKIRELATYGAWGIHASLLPKYAGGAPLVWAMINGETETGVTLFRLADGVDDGDIIAQEKITIEYKDYICDVYEKAKEVSADIVIENLSNIDEICFHPQDRATIEVYPQRSPEDGEIDLSMSAKKIYDFIRAQSKPYPGAFIRTGDGKKLIIDSVHIED